jgi:hypothetical protein
LANLYEYAIWCDEKLDKDGNVVDPATIIQQPKVTVAPSEQVVHIRASKEIPDTYETQVGEDRVIIAIRPFSVGK